VARALHDGGFLILGGDVLSVDREGRLGYTMDNWFTDEALKEAGSDESRIRRAYEETIRFITSYAEGRRSIYYAFVYKAE